ncbi:MAG TPA: CotH kinase family protein [Planctomycetota bacterium]|nr:CotH kinase family protein [Planctomycetota bacterium]
MLTTMLRIQCPSCQTAYQVDPEKLGKKLRCRKCEAIWNPAASAAAKAPTAPSGAQPAQKKAPAVSGPAPKSSPKKAAAAHVEKPQPVPADVPKVRAKSARRPLMAAAFAVVVLAGIGVGLTLAGRDVSKAASPAAADTPQTAKRPEQEKREPASAGPEKSQVAKPQEKSKGASEAAAVVSESAKAAKAPASSKPAAVVAETSEPAKAAAKTGETPKPPKEAKKAAVSPEALEADAFFKTPRVVELSLEIAPGDYEALKREPRKYVRATLKEGNKVWNNVAVHLKGAAGSFRGIDDKAGLTINMDKNVDGQHFHGIDKFHLNNSVQDPSYISELICGEIFRQAGVPTSRCAHAILTLNGKLKGFFVLKEGYDVAFIEKNFGTKKGNFYDGGFLRDIDQQLQIISQKDDVAPYSELKSLWNAAALPDPAVRFKELERLLDGDRWVSYLALEVLMHDWDGYPTNRNNYRIYHDPKRDKIVFIPSGTDQMFADLNFNLLPNFNGVIAKAYVTTPEGRQRYLNRMDEILKTLWKPAEWSKRLDEVEAVIKPALAKVDAGHAQHLSGHIGRFKNAFVQRQQIASKNLNRFLNPTPPKTIAGGPGLPDDGFLRKYLFLGPVSVQGTPGAQAIHKDLLGGEAGVKPAVGTKTKTTGGELAWKAFEAHDGMVDFHAASGKQADFSACYLAAYLVCEKDFKDLKLKMGSDDQGKVWINGKDVLKYEGDRGAAPDQDNADNIVLNKGVNTLLFKVVNGAGGFQGILRFTHPDGTPFMDARLSLSPDGK